MDLITKSVQIYETFRTVGRCKNTDDQLEIKKFTTPQEVPPYNSYKGMRRPTGSYFWDSDLKRSIIIKPFSRTGYNFSNARKLQNIIGDFNSRTGY